MSTLNQFYREDSGTNTILSIAEFMHTSSGTPASGLGSKILLGAENSTGTAKSGAEIQGYLSTVTAAAEQGVFLLQLRNAGTLQDALQITAGTNSATIASNQTTVTLWNATATTVNAFGAATTIDFGYLTGTKTLRFSRGATTASDLFLWDWSVAGTVRWRWRFQGQETGANAGSTIALQAYDDGGTYISDILQLYRASGTGVYFLRPVLLSTGSGLTTDQTTIAIVNTTATTVNFAGAATAINMGAGASTTITLSATTAVALNTAAVTSNQTTVALFNATATTLNIGGAATTITFAGSTTGYVVWRVGGASTAGAELDIVSAAGNYRTFVFKTGLGSTSPRWYVGANNTAESGSNAGSNFYVQAADDSGAAIDTPFQITRVSGGAITITRPLVGGTTQACFNTTTTTLNLGGAATTIAIGASTGTCTIANATVSLTGATAFNVTPPATFTGNVTMNGAANVMGDTTTDALTFTGRCVLRAVTDAGPMTATGGTAGEIVRNTSDSKFYGCTVTHASAATWVALN